MISNFGKHEEWGLGKISINFIIILFSNKRDRFGANLKIMAVPGCSNHLGQFITNKVFTLMGVNGFTIDVVRKSLDKITIYYSYWYFLISFYNDRILGDH